GFGRSRGDFGGDIPGTEGGGDPVAHRTGLLVGEGDEDRRGYGPAGRQGSGAEEQPEQPGDADRDTHTGEPVGAGAGQVVVPAAGADRPDPPVPGPLRL